MSAPKDDIIVTRVDQDVHGKPINEATETTSLLSAGARDGESSCEDTWPGYADFEHLPWWRTPSVFWLLIPYALFTLAFGGSLVPKLNLIVDLVCQRHFADETALDPAFVFTPVILGADNPQCLIPEVKKRVSMFTLAINLLTGILSAITAPKLGQLSDRYGRRKLLALASCGGVVAELIVIMCANFPWTFHYNWLLLGAVADGLTGSFTAGSVLINSYTSDCTAPSQRGVRIGYLHACLFSGLAFGPLLTGYFAAWTGNLLSVFYVTMGCHIYFIIFVGFIVPESLSVKRQLRARQKHKQEKEAKAGAGTWSAIKAANPLAPLKTLWPTGPGTSSRLRLNIAALSFTDMILLGSAMSAGTVILLYSESPETWGWGTLESSRYISAVSMVRVVALLVVLPLVNYVFRVRPAAYRRRVSGVSIVEANNGADSVDCWILRFALLSDVTGSLGYLFARNEAVFVLSGMVTAFGGLGSATIQAAITKHVPADQVGQLLGAIGVLHALSRVLGPIAFNTLYYSTVGVFDQAIFVLLASLFGLALLASFIVRPGVFLEETYEPIPSSVPQPSSNASSEALENERLRSLENPFEVCTMIFPLICLLLLQAAPLTLGAPRRALSPPRRRETILDVDFNGDGEDMVREILNRPYNTRHNDGSDSNKPFYGVRFSESDEGRARVARGDPINMEALRTVIDEHDLEWTLIEEVEVDDDLSEDGEDEVVRRVHEQGTLDKDAYSDPERRDVEDGLWNRVLRDRGNSEDPFEKPKFREGQGGFVHEQTPPPPTELIASAQQTSSTRSIAATQVR
ncbi:major facilitator superfamily transporter [Colletotrichum lupini]|uniref:Major facilitator superfamily transporter n=1 Tax=Colletotrichum lupini TaxID=145971 RepID=A0A9Q8WNE8_9PEZI|nr:major facilitator superfamily transporter [Colletotrichum lupini]UQC89769.1 major facilitator superfamily transporter [Colletotrichum lupini]